MHTTRRTSSQAPSALDRATRWWETAYTSVTWDYPPSPAAHRDALLSRGASHFMSTSDPSTAGSPIVSSSPSTPSTPPSTFSPDVPPIPRPSATPRSAHPTSHLVALAAPVHLRGDKETATTLYYCRIVIPSRTPMHLHGHDTR